MRGHAPILHAVANSPLYQCRTLDASQSTDDTRRDHRQLCQFPRPRPPPTSFQDGRDNRAGAELRICWSIAETDRANEVRRESMTGG